MKLYLVSNNMLLEGINYDLGANLEIIRLLRGLSIEGEKTAKEISNLECFKNVEKIISSFHSSALSTAKYLAKNLELEIEINEKFNDCKVGTLGSKNMKMVKGLQDHEFTYKLPNGESLIDVGNRINNGIYSILNNNMNTVIFTHKRAILGFLLKYAKVDYNLDENLILEFNDKIIYDDSDTSYDIYEITFDGKELVDINILS